MNKIFNACHSLNKCLETVEVAALDCLELLDNSVDEVVFSLFSKLRSHYFSFIVVTVYRDEIGSLFLINQIYKTLNILIYLLEDKDKDRFYQYMKTSVVQMERLLNSTTFFLDNSSGHPGLLKLKNKLEFYLNRASLNRVEFSISSAEEIGVDSLNVINNHRVTQRSLRFCLASSCNLLLMIHPASYLNLQLNYMNDDLEQKLKRESRINLWRIRDISHLYIYGTEIFLDLAMEKCQSISLIYEELDRLSKIFTRVCSIKWHDEG